jgi:hypothetical protein
LKRSRKDSQCGWNGKEWAMRKVLEDEVREA